MIIEIEVGVIAVAVVVLVGFGVPILIQIKKTAEESACFLKNLNNEIPILLKEATGILHNLNEATGDLRQGTEKAKLLGEAIGEIGETVNQVHGAIRTGASSLWLNANGLLAGVRAAVGVLARGARHDHPDGGQGSDR